MDPPPTDPCCRSGLTGKFNCTQHLHVFSRKTFTLTQCDTAGLHRLDLSRLFLILLLFRGISGEWYVIGWQNESISWLYSKGQDSASIVIGRWMASCGAVWLPSSKLDRYSDVKLCARMDWFVRLTTPVRSRDIGNSSFLWKSSWFLSIMSVHFQKPAEIFLPLRRFPGNWRKVELFRKSKS